MIDSTKKLKQDLAIVKSMVMDMVNYVWRADGYPELVIVKSTLPYLTTMPDILLDIRRSINEGRVLTAFESDGLLAGISSPAMRPENCRPFFGSESLKVTF